MDRLCASVAKDGADRLISAQARPTHQPLVSRRLPPVDRVPDQRDFGPTLAREKLFERHGLLIGRETLRGLMRKAGLERPAK